MTQESGRWPEGTSSSGLPHPAQETVHSGPVSPWSHAGYLPPVDPVPAPVMPPASHADAEPMVPASTLPAPTVPAPTVPAQVPPPPRDAAWRPARVEAVPGTDFGVVHLQVAPVTSGMAVGALVAGIAALLVGFLVLCFGLAGAADGWGAWVAGAFTVLGVVAGGGGVGLGSAALRQIRTSGRPGLIRFSGRGAALAGVWCGGIGLGTCLLALALSVLLQVL